MVTKTPGPTTYFPELEGAERERADEWLREYIKLIVDLHRHLEATGQLEAAMAEIKQRQKRKESPVPSEPVPPPIATA